VKASEKTRQLFSLDFEKKKKKKLESTGDSPCEGRTRKWSLRKEKPGA